jgi:HAD superfamily hydrolase (TIGR01544 family)
VVAPFNPHSKIEVLRPAYLAEKLNDFKTAGSKQIHVVADFDSTLTVQKYQGHQADTTFSVLSHISHRFKKRTEELARVFYEKQTNLELSTQERGEIINEWWVKALTTCLEEDLYEYNLPDLFWESQLYLRHGIAELMEKTLKYNVPFSIVSGGIGNFVEMALKNVEGPKNYQLKANFMTFDDRSRRLNGCTQPIIHSFNKAQSVSQIKLNPYVILLGDSVPDIKALQGSVYEEAITVGFLREGKNERLFREVYDFVIKEDGNLDFAVKLVSWVAGENVKFEELPELEASLASLESLVY